MSVSSQRPWTVTPNHICFLKILFWFPNSENRSKLLAWCRLPSFPLLNLFCSYMGHTNPQGGQASILSLDSAVPSKLSTRVLYLLQSSVQCHLFRKICQYYLILKVPPSSVWTSCFNSLTHTCTYHDLDSSCLLHKVRECACVTHRCLPNRRHSYLWNAWICPATLPAHCHS